MTRRSITAVAALFALFLFAPAANAAKRSTPSKATISVLSSRADLVSGDSALVQVDFSRAADIKKAKVVLGKRSVKGAFSKSSSKQLRGLVDRPQGRQEHAHRQAARRPRRDARPDQPPDRRPGLLGPAAQAVDVPVDGEGRAVQPAGDLHVHLQVDRRLEVGLPGLRPGEPADRRRHDDDRPGRRRCRSSSASRPATWTATSTRSRRSSSPASRGRAVAPQKQFNHKLLITHGVACGVDHQTGTAPRVSPTAAPPTTALGARLRVMSTALDNSGHNCNLAVQAESLIMAKEHLIERYGTLRYTIGTGCSGGSLAEQWIANAYPGIYQGILPTCSFPDAWGTATQFLDYHLMLAYFKDPSKWGTGVAWTPPQMADVQGHISIGNSRSATPPSSTSSSRPTRAPASPTQQRYNPNTNPGGVRCYDPGRGDQHLRPAAAVRLGAAGEAGRPRLRRPAGRQRRRPVRARRAAEGPDHAGAVRRPQRRRSAASTSTPTRRPRASPRRVRRSPTRTAAA